MRVGFFIAAGLLVLGGVLSYFLYGQLHTETILIAAEAEAYAGPDGAPCETMAFSLEPRQMGRMSVMAEKGQSINGRFVVQGGIEGDVAFRVFAPHGRMVVDEGRAAPAGGPKVALIDVDGLLVNTRLNGPYSAGENPVALFREKLDAAALDTNVCAVVLRINTPGGGVAAADLMWQQLHAFRARTGLPVVA